MYGMDNDTILEDKIGFTIIYSLTHILFCFFICILVHGFCAVAKDIEVFIALPLCGYLTNTFIRKDMIPLWKI